MNGKDHVRSLWGSPQTVFAGSCVRRATVATTPDPMHLTCHHRDTLLQIPRHAVDCNIEWRAARRSGRLRTG